MGALSPFTTDGRVVDTLGPDVTNDAGAFCYSFDHPGLNTRIEKAKATGEIKAVAGSVDVGGGY